jgi:hypothetical protein
MHWIGIKLRNITEFSFNKGEKDLDLLFRNKTLIVEVDISEKLDRLFFWVFVHLKYIDSTLL